MHLTFFYSDAGHYLENTGNTTLHYLEIFDTGRFPSNMAQFRESLMIRNVADRFQDISLTQVQ
jgi:hypothetical protein